MCSSTSLQKEISTFAVLIVHVLMRESSVEVDTEGFLSSGYNVTGIIVNFCCSIRKAPPLIDTFIVPRGAAFLYALFEYGLTD